MRKGQEEAPIELLLGVTILTFVVILGFYTYQNMCVSLYEQKLKESLSTFARNLELVYQGGEQNSKVVSVDFTESGCSIGIQSIRLFGGTFTACRKIGKEDCLELVAVKKDSEGNTYPFVTEVLNIPPDVAITLTNPHDCSAVDEDNIGGSVTSSYCWSATTYTFQIRKISAAEMELKEL